MPRLCVIVALVVFVAAPAAGQTLSELIPQLIQEGAVTAASDPAAGSQQTQHFVRGLQLTSVPARFNAALALQVADIPLGPTAGSLIYSRTGVGPEMHQTYGTAYTDRARTIGAGAFGASLMFLNNNYSTFEDANLRGDGATFLVAHAGPQPNVSDVLEETVSVRLNRKVTTFFFQYGVTNRFDISLAAPVEQVSLDVRVFSRVVRVPQPLDALRVVRQPHGFDDVLTLGTTYTYLGVNLTPAVIGNNYGEVGRSTIGIGDLHVSSKYSMVATPHTALAGAVELGLPTGSKDNFLGTGAWLVKPSVIWSGEAGRTSVHANAGYTFAYGDLSSKLQNRAPTTLDLAVPNEVNWAAGLATPVLPRLTLVADVVGKRYPNVDRFTTAPSIFAFSRPGGPAQDVAAASSLISNGLGPLNHIVGVVGGRINLGGTVFVNGAVVFPLSKDGLRPQTTLMMSVDSLF